MYLADLTWRNAEDVLKKPETVVVIPVGSTEQHGDAGPLGTDWMIPEAFAQRLNEQDPSIVITPIIPFGIATHHTNFAGTIDLGLECMTMVMRRVMDSLFAHGARRFVVINGHGGNDPAIDQAALAIYRKGGLVSAINWWSIAPKLNKAWPTGHGDAQEISALMAIKPELIKPENFTESIVTPVAPDLPQVHINTVLFEGAPVKIVRDIADTVSTGGLGGLDSSHATREWGVAMMDAMTVWIEHFVERFKTLPLPSHNEKN